MAHRAGLARKPAAGNRADDVVLTEPVGDLERLRADVPRTGLATPAGARTLHEVARDVLAIAAGGLKRRAVKGIHDPDERSYLTVLNEIVESGRTPAEELLEAYHGRWGGSVDPAFSELAY